MRRAGILEEEGFSETFASCMQGCLGTLMKKFQAKVGYTQSDEMCVFIPPTSVRLPHPRLASPRLAITLNDCVAGLR